MQGEAAALDRFISFEVTPAAQQAFDAAVLEHAKASDLLEGPRTALPKVVDAEQRQSGARRSESPQAVSSSNTNDGCIATPVPAGCATAGAGEADDVFWTKKTTSAVVAAAAATSSDATTGANAGVNNNFVEYGMISSPTEGWRGAKHVPVITEIPPPAFSDRANLPARGSPGTLTGHPPIVDSIGRDGGGGGGSATASVSRRWSARTVPYRTQDETGMAVVRYRQEGEGEVETTGRSQRQGKTAKNGSGQGRIGDGVLVGGRVGTAVGNATRKSEFDEQEDDVEEEEDGEYDGVGVVRKTFRRERKLVVGGSFNEVKVIEVSIFACVLLCMFHRCGVVQSARGVGR